MSMFQGTDCDQLRPVVVLVSFLGISLVPPGIFVVILLIWLQFSTMEYTEGANDYADVLVDLLMHRLECFWNLLEMFPCIVPLAVEQFDSCS